MTTHFSFTDKNLLLRHGPTAVLQLAQRRGGQLHKLLSGTSIFEQDLMNPQSRCHHRDWLKLLSHCQQLQSPELPFLLADSVLNHRNIALCQSIAVAANLAQSLKQLCYFRHQLLPALYPKIKRIDNKLMLSFKPAIALGVQQHFISILAISFLVKLIRQQLADSSQLHVLLKQATPANEQLFKAHWQCQVSFNQQFDAILIPLAYWHQSFADSNPHRFQQYRQACYQLNQRLPAQRGLLEHLQRQIDRALPRQLGIEDAAALLGLSCSSLKRLLQQHNTNFAAIADEVRRDKAHLLLLQGNYSNRQLAEQLGYSDEHNFRRAFKRWTGMLPSSAKALTPISF
ncbi:AraC family transcriptional regulator [Alishewanella longhuensis]|uniref:AraC family transcriptional regulator n=1 Tax=Alishewanella longhuensis TaxID=1091037 RepID=A0ABQ3KTL3_9ALTE|nr:AraC family transcriptional regulator [Alishewanella longhuensis]GHG60455.1 AraC family transcriptional regulator [Alishewanella longhuensis]